MPFRYYADNELTDDVSSEPPGPVLFSYQPRTSQGAEGAFPCW